jgi:son of sevenless-like protein
MLFTDSKKPGNELNITTRSKQVYTLIFANSFPQMESLETASDLISPERSFAKMRKFLKDVEPPCVPYLGLNLVDLTFIEDGSLSFMPMGTINWRKYTSISRVIEEIAYLQSIPYNLEPVSSMMGLLLHWKTSHQLDEQALYKRSLAIEPKQSQTGVL